MPCDGVMTLTSTATDVSGTSRETWECNICHAREFVTCVEAVELDAPEEPEPQFFCTFCHNPYDEHEDDELHACPACATWYRMQPCN